MLLFLLLTISDAARLRTSTMQLELGIFYLEPALPDEDYIAYDCSITTTRYIREVCELCNADIAYAIPEPDVSYLEGYYQEDQDRIEPVLIDFSLNVPQASAYGVAINSTHICLSATQFDSEEDLEELLDYFVNIEEVPIEIPEIFSEVSLEASFISVRSNGTYYDYFAIEYITLNTFQATDTVFLQLEYVYNYFVEALGTYVYSGTSEISGNNFEFAVTTEYVREEFEDFTVEIEILEEFSVNELGELIAPEANCAQVSAPLGLSSFQSFLVDSVSLVYTFSADDEEMMLIYEKMFFNLPDFAVAPNVEIIENIGVLVIEFQVDECGYEVIGLWNYLDYSIVLTVYDNNQTLHMEANGEFSEEEKISILQVENDFFEPLFPEDLKMFPIFLPSDPQLLLELKEVDIPFPFIQLYFEPDLSYNIYGTDEKSSIEALSGRVDGVIQTVVHKYTTGPDDLEDIGYAKVQNDIMFSSGNIDIEVYFTMASMLDPDRENWYVGVSVEAIIEFNDFCKDNAFCGLLEKYAVTPTGQLDLRGTVVNDTVTVDYEIIDILFSSSVKFQEVGLSLQYTSYGHLPIFVGAFYLPVDADTILRFEGTISQGNDLESAVLKSQCFQIWEEVLESPKITAIGISLQGTLEDSGEIISIETISTGLIGINCFTDLTISPLCFQGSLSLSLDFVDYEKNSFTLGVFNITTLDFFNYFVGYDYESIEEIQLPQSCMEFPAGFFLQYEYGGEFVMSGDILFCGVFGNAVGSIENIGSGTLECEVDLEDFYFASENAKMMENTGFISVYRENGSSSGSISGTLNIWGWETPVVFSLSEKFSTSFSGKIYQGIYSYDVTLYSSSSSDITSTNFTMNLSVNPNAVSSEEAFLRSKLINWVESGFGILKESEKKFTQFSIDLGVLKSHQCDPVLTCPNSTYCSENLSEKCVEHEIVQNCLGGNGCSVVQVLCTSVEVICVKEDNDCEGNCKCLAQVEVCKKWESQCIEESSECKEKVIEKDVENCAKTVISCDKVEELEIECRLRCDWNKEVYGLAKTEYLMYEKGFNLTQTDLKGFDELTQLMQERFDMGLLVKITKISASEELTTSGIGPYDFEFEAFFEVASIQSNSLVKSIKKVWWNFYDENSNQGELMKKAKEALVDLSGNSLTTDLNFKSAREVMEENIEYL